MAGPQTEVRSTPPYVPFKTFLSFLDSLKDTVVPQRIDASVMGKYSGTLRTQLRTALRFLDLIDDSGTVKPGLRTLVAARGTTGWQDAISNLIFDQYTELVGDMDLDNATLNQLKERFRAAGAEGSVLIKAVRFYLAALDATGSHYSPHFKVRALSTGVQSSRKPKARGTSNGKAAAATKREPPPPEEVAVPTGSQRFALPVKDKPQAILILPTDMTATEWRMIESYIRMYYGVPDNGQ